MLLSKIPADCFTQQLQSWLTLLWLFRLLNRPLGRWLGPPSYPGGLGPLPSPTRTIVIILAFISVFNRFLETFLQHAKGTPFPAWRAGEVPWHAGDSNPSSHLLANFPISFCVNFLGKPGEKITNGDHMITRHLTTNCKYRQVSKHPKYNHMTGEAVHYFTKALSALWTIKHPLWGHHDCEWLLNDWS